jgi:hypothetical protein
VGLEKSAGEEKRFPFLLEALEILDGFCAVSPSG